jgi:hypothetical protein
MASDSTTLDEALALLELPALDGLSEPQVRGQSCVWCAIVLTPETAVDLGPRRKKHLGAAYDWFPRGCRKHVGLAAEHALQGHAPFCEPCTENVADCETGLVLLRLIREGRR